MLTAVFDNGCQRPVVDAPQEEASCSFPHALAVTAMTACPWQGRLIPCMLGGKL